MITLRGVFRSAIISMSVALIAPLAAGAQPKPGMSKTVFENGKVAVLDNILKPGEGLPSADRGGLILYYLSGGKVERTFADGTKKTNTPRSGEAFVNPEKRPYSVENTGSTTLHVVAIRLK